ncbi:MAG: hypothetical protein Fur0018_05250 [Anaerolineales bacterium]
MFGSHRAQLPAWLSFERVNREPTPVASPTATPAPKPSPTPDSTPITLTIWISPDFDPAADNPAGKILREHLAYYERRRTNVQVNVRVKALEGEGGIINSLITASAAAPDALPALVLVSQTMLESCVLKGVCYPYDGLLSISDADWFDFALTTGQMQGRTFGLPFATDLLTLAYRPARIAQPPASWAALMQTPAPLLFYAADPQATYVTMLYMAAGGLLLDDTRKPTLTRAPLLNTITTLSDAHKVGRFPAYLLQYKNETEVWQAYMDGTSAMALTWASQYLKNPPADTVLTMPPTPTGVPFTLGRTWLWVLTTPNSEQQALGVELAAYLTMPDFMARWNTAAGYLPTRSTTMDAWQNPTLRDTLKPILLAARPLPPGDIHTPLQPLLYDALEQTLLEKNPPETILDSILERLP